MIQYNPKAWFSLIFTLYTRQIVRMLLPLLSFICAFTAVVTYVIQDVFHVQQHMDGIGIFHSLLGIVLGLFLVLRTNTAYDRWWEGRKIWGNLINDSRLFAIKVRTFLPSPQARKSLNHMITDFAFALKGYLRSNVNIQELSNRSTRIVQAKHTPNIIALHIYEVLQAQYKKGEITGEQFFILDKEARGLVQHLGACERIKNTPIPYSYHMYIKKFIFMYSLTLPFAFIPHMGYWSVFLVGFTFYALVSIALIAEEIEDPFGLDVNDLPLNELCGTIKANVEEIAQDIPEETTHKQ